MGPRIALVVGGFLALITTPAFALSYFLSFGGAEGESPPGWLAPLRGPLLDLGLLQSPGSSAAFDLYGLYGKLYFVAWVMALAGLWGLLRGEWSGFGPRLRRAWTILLAGLGMAAAGILGDYTVMSGWVNALSFGLEVSGFLVAVTGCGLLGVALRRERAVSVGASAAVFSLGIVSVVGGFALVSHIPSGLGLGFAGTAMALGFAGPRLARA